MDEFPRKHLHVSQNAEIPEERQTRTFIKDPENQSIVIETYREFDLGRDLSPDGEAHIFSGPHRVEYVLVRSRNVGRGRIEFQFTPGCLPGDPRMTDFAVYPLLSGEPTTIQVGESATFGRLSTSSKDAESPAELLSGAKPFRIYPESIEIWRDKK